MYNLYMESIFEKECVKTRSFYYEKNGGGEDDDKNNKSNAITK